MKEYAVTLVNIGMWAGWVFLAIHFNHWWIALFGLLTLFSSSKEK